ncbi:MAG: sensor domain-containing diguanylate cyclase [Limnothrix sp.]
MQPLIKLTCWLGGSPTPQQLNQQLAEKKDQLAVLDEQQRALNRVISKIRGSLELETIFRTTTKETCKLLQVQRVTVYRFFEGWGGEFINDFEFAEPGWDELEKLGQNTVWNDSYLQETKGGRYRKNQSLVVNDIYDAELSQCHIDVLEQFYIRAYATAPIFIGKKLWGVLAAYQHSKPCEWQDTQVQFLTQVATHLGFAVKQAELLSQSQQKAKALQMACEQQQILFSLVTEIRETLDLDTLFKTMVKETRKTLRADRVGIFQFDANSYDTGQFVAEHVLPAYDSVLATPVYDHCFGERYAVYYEQGRIQVVSDIETTDLEACHLDVLRQFQIKAQVITPLLRKGHLWGLLCVHQCGQVRQWQDTEVLFIQRLAAQFSIALGHAELLAHSRQQAAELTQTMQDLEQSNAMLERLNNTDALTGVANRRCFDDVLAKEWRRLQCQGECLSLILFDVDFFKSYNDHYGHPAGDACLVRIAQAAQSTLKRSPDLLARYGGEEFAVILPRTGRAEAVRVGEEIQAAIANLGILHEHSASRNKYVTASLGVTSTIPTATGSVKALIEAADKALYQGKKQGRNCLVYR